jgi:hypothetical protein
VAAQARPRRPPRFRPLPGTDPDAPGLKVTADLHVCEAGLCIDAVATNGGPRTYHVSSICVPPWSDSMRSDGRAVQPHPSRASCLAFGTKPFGPGASNATTFSWDQRLWDSGHAEPAPQGGYDWAIHFLAYDDAGGGGRHDLNATLHLIVGET